MQGVKVGYQGIPSSSGSIAACAKVWHAGTLHPYIFTQVCNSKQSKMLVCYPRYMRTIVRELLHH